MAVDLRMERIRGCIERLVREHHGTKEHGEALFNFLLGSWGDNMTELRDRVMALSTYFNNHKNDEQLIFDMFFTDESGFHDLVSAALRGTNPNHVSAQKRQKIAAPAAAPVAFAPDIVTDVLGQLEMKLFDFQEAAVRQMQKQRGLILSYATGNGKTLVAVASAQVAIAQNHALRVIVIAPKSLIENFQIGMEKCGVPRHDVHYSFYTFEGFSNAWLTNTRLTEGAFLIVDESHHGRTLIYSNLRCKIKTRFVKIKNIDEARRTPEQHRFMEKFKLIGDTLSASARHAFSHPLEDVQRRTGISINEMAPKSLRLIEAARIAEKVLLLTATPCYNESRDVCNLVSMVKGQGVMSRRYFKSLQSDDFAFRNHFRNMFAFKDVDPNDPDFPKLEIETVRIPMTQEYYQQYHAIEMDMEADWSSPWVFMGGVRQATLALEDNPKCQYVLDKLLAEPNETTLIYSAFISKGLKKMQKRVEEKHIDHFEITGDTPVDERAGAVLALNNKDANVLFISNAGGEGLDLKGLTRGYLLETEWNFQQTLQVIGRGPRRHSHAHMPAAQRVCKFTQLILTKPPKELRKPNDKFDMSADELLEKLTREKQLEIDPFIARLKACAACR